MLPRRQQRPAEPLFPAYLFVRCDLDVVGLSTLEFVPGLRRILAFAGRPAVVPDEVIALIEEKLAEIDARGGLPSHSFHPGDEVVIDSGPMRGMRGIFQGPMGPAERVQVLIRFLGQANRAEVPIELLRTAPQRGEARRGHTRAWATDPLQELAEGFRRSLPPGIANPAERTTMLTDSASNRNQSSLTGIHMYAIVTLVVNPCREYLSLINTYVVIVGPDLHRRQRTDIIGALTRCSNRPMSVKEIRGMATAMQLGWVVALSVLLPLGAGLLLDHLLSTAPLFILIGAVLGILISTVGAVRIALRGMQDIERRHERSEDAADPDVEVDDEKERSVEETAEHP